MGLPEAEACDGSHIGARCVSYGRHHVRHFLDRNRPFCLDRDVLKGNARSGRRTNGGTIAMRIESLAAIAIAVLAAGTGLAVNPVGSLPSEKQSMMGAAQVGDRLAASVDTLLHRSVD